VPGIVLFPVAVLLAVLASAETLHLASAAGLHPVASAVYGGNLLIIIGCWSPVFWSSMIEHDLDWPASSVIFLLAAYYRPSLALAIGVLLAFAGEMRRYERPGSVTANLAAAVLALVYVGLMLSFVVQLRLMWGIVALASLVIVVKMGDIGAYSVGRLVGRHKMAPTLSPGKTVEGAIGSLAFGCLGSWATFCCLIPWLGVEHAECGFRSNWLAFGLLVGGAGILGDLAESLLKRDVGLKDSGSWLPGFGGVLDILDSILVAAPVAYACWAFGLVGP